MATFLKWLFPMNFPALLIRLRKARGFSQQALADAVGLHVNQIKRYESGTASPTLEALVKLATTLHVTLDELVFDEGERGPEADLRLQFEAIEQMSPEEKQVIRTVIEGLLLRHDAQRWLGKEKSG